MKTAAPRRRLPARTSCRSSTCTPDGLDRLLAAGPRAQARPRHADAGAQPLAGRHVALLFEKPSLRTRITFVIAVRELGGEVIEPPPDVIFGGRETVEDVARNLERWVAGAVVRTFAQSRLARFAAAASRLHVVNALTDEEHPCQALADMMTLQERLGSLDGPDADLRGRWQQRRGVARARRLDARPAHAVRVAARVTNCPRRVIAACTAWRARRRRSRSRTTRSGPWPAPTRSTRTSGRRWARSRKPPARARVFRPFQVNDALMEGAAPRRRLHALPARAPRHRGHRRGDGLAALGGLRSGREPAARAEGAARACSSRRLRRNGSARRSVHVPPAYRQLSRYAHPPARLVTTAVTPEKNVALMNVGMVKMPISANP